jgi:hypothetical protein
MKGQRRSWHIKTRLDVADIQAGGPSPNQQPIDIKAR